MFTCFVKVKLVVPGHTRLNNFKLSVSDDNVTYTDCASYPSDISPNTSVTLPCETTGRYVRFQRVGISDIPGDIIGYVTLCEVVIIGYRIVGGSGGCAVNLSQGYKWAWNKLILGPFCIILLPAKLSEAAGGKWDNRWKCFRLDLDSRSIGLRSNILSLGKGTTFKGKVFKVWKCYDNETRNTTWERKSPLAYKSPWRINFLLSPALEVWPPPPLHNSTLT